MKSKTCKNCKYRDNLYTCTNEKLGEDSDYIGHEGDHLAYPYHEGASFCVGPDFGCVHFKRKAK